MDGWLGVETKEARRVVRHAVIPVDLKPTPCTPFPAPRNVINNSFDPTGVEPACCRPPLIPYRHGHLKENMTTKINKLYKVSILWNAWFGMIGELSPPGLLALYL